MAKTDTKKVHYTMKQKLMVQVQAEIDFGEKYREQVTKEDWRRNDEVMRGYQESDDATRNKTPLFQAIAFEETLLSKIDNAMSFKFAPGGLEDKKKALKFNALRERDEKVDRWDKKNRQGKRHMSRYGRMIFGYMASAPDGKYKPDLFNIRPRHFYIDPNCGNNKEKALFLGWYGVILGAWQLEAGIEAGIYDKKATNDLIAAGGNYNNLDDDLDERKAGTSTTADAVVDKKIWRNDMFIFYQAFTTGDDGERYILLMTKSGQCIRCERWKDKDPSGLYPIWTAAASPDDAQFWSIAPITRVRRIFKSQEKSINQMLDNSDQVNKPKLAVNIDYVRNLSQVKFGTKGFIEVTGNKDIDEIVKAMPTPSTQVPSVVYDKLQTVVDRQSGITPETAGVSDTKGTLGIVDRNIEAQADRINLLDLDLSEGVYEFAVLYKNGVRNNLTNKVAVKILGPNGLGMEDITWTDLDPGDYDYDIIISSSDSESKAEEEDDKAKVETLTTFIESKDPMVNQKLAREKVLEYSNFDDDEIRGLLDVQDGSEGMMSQAYEDFEKLLKGEKVIVPRNATIAYMQSFKDLWEEKDNKIEKDYGARRAPMIHKKIEDYLNLIQQVVQANIAMDAAMAEAAHSTPTEEELAPAQVTPAAPTVATPVLPTA